MKEYIAVKSGDHLHAPPAPRRNSPTTITPRKYKDVIDDGEALKKNGALDATSMQIVAQAYYLSGDKQGCLKYIKNNFGANPSDTTLELQMRCAYDARTRSRSARRWKPWSPTPARPEYWNDLLKMSERGQGMRDHDTLDIYRLKLLTGTISGKDEYTTLAQLALQLGFPAEAAGRDREGPGRQAPERRPHQQAAGAGQDPGRG